MSRLDLGVVLTVEKELDCAISPGVADGDDVGRLIGDGRDVDETKVFGKAEVDRAPPGLEGDNQGWLRGLSDRDVGAETIETLQVIEDDRSILFCVCRRDGHSRRLTDGRSLAAARDPTTQRDERGLRTAEARGRQVQRRVRPLACYYRRSGNMRAAWKTVAISMSSPRNR